jgi:hypothetical protein
VLRFTITLIFLVGVLCSGNEPYKYGVVWKSWSSETREAYVSGMVDGVAAAYFTCVAKLVGFEKINKLPLSKKDEEIRQKLFVRYTQEQIPAVMSDLYKDPANVYVSNQDMLFIARDKIEGKDIEDKIKEARSSAMKNHELNLEK